MISIARQFFSLYRLTAKGGCLLFALLVYTGLYGQGETKISPDVWKVIDQGQSEVEVIVVFTKQLNPSDFKQVKDYRNRSYQIQQALIAQQQQQESVRRLLNQERHDYQSFHIFNMINLQAGEQLLNQLAVFPEVDQIVLNSSVVQDIQPVTQPIQLRSTEWGIRNINADRVWGELGFKGAGVVVGGQDTGYDWDHSAVRKQYRGYQNEGEVMHHFNWHDAIHEYFQGGNPCGIELEVPCDDHGHGTHTIGTIVGDDGMGNQIGVAPEAEWIGCRNMEEGIGTLASYAECFEWFFAPYPIDSSFEEGKVELAPQVINNSWSCPPTEGCNSSNFFILDSIVSLLRQAGIAVVVSAGNSGPNCQTVSTPAAIFDASITVGATDADDEIAGFSSRGTVGVDGSKRMKPDVSAPGVGIRSALPDERYGISSGTSMAGPHVAGAIALMISANPLLAGEVDTLEAILKRTARPKVSTQDCGAGNEAVPNNVFGHGIIDAYAAVTEAMKTKNTFLLDFWGTRHEKANLLYWSTEQEIYTKSFEVQRSFDQNSWITFTDVDAQGRSNTHRFYSASDENFEERTYYRLAVKDQFEDYDYSHSILIDRTLDNPLFLAPNPAHKEVRIVGGAIDSWEDFQFELYDTFGKSWMAGKPNGVSLDISQIPGGVYILKIMDRRGRSVYSGKLVIQH